MNYEISLKAFIKDCRNDPQLKRLRRARRVLTALLTVGVVATLDFFTIGILSAYAAALLIVAVSGLIQRKRKEIRSQYLGL